MTVLQEVENIDFNVQNIRGFETFFIDFQNDLIELNSLIAAYNRHNNIRLLREIYLKQQTMQDHYSDKFISESSNYRQKIHIELFKGLKDEFKKAGIHSVSPEALQDEDKDYCSSSPSALPDILLNMPPEKLNHFLEILLHHANQYNHNRTISDKDSSIPLSSALQAIYSFDKHSEGDDYHFFQDFLYEHTFHFLGGSNCKNFLVINQFTQKALVLKVENNMGSFKSAATYLRTQTDSLLSQVLARRTAFCLEPQTGSLITRDIIAMEYCPFMDLQTSAERLTNDDSKLSSALSIYAELAYQVLKLQRAGCAFTDLKNSNVLIDANKKLKIADPKGFVFTQQGQICRFEDPLNLFDFIYTKYMAPPEILNKAPAVSADAMHAFLLGKCLYHFLTCCSADYLQNGHVSARLPIDFLALPSSIVHDQEASYYDFNAPIFSSELGQQLKLLILHLLCVDPNSRMSVENLCLHLQRVNGNKLLTLIKNEALGPHDKILHNFVKSKQSEITYAVATRDIEGLHHINHTLHFVNQELKNSSEYQQLKQRFQFLKTYAGFFNVRSAFETNLTLTGISQCPLEERGKQSQLIQELLQNMGLSTSESQTIPIL